MAQNDWDFPLLGGDNIFNARVPINSALENLATNHAGTAAPATVHSRMWWADTTNSKMKLENGAGGWLEIFKLEADGGLVSKAAPTIGADFNMATFTLHNLTVTATTGALPTPAYRWPVKDAAGTGILGYIPICPSWT